MEKETLTVILPCAGLGSRLDLKSPKELFEIVPGTRLIDFSLNHIQAIYEKRVAPATQNATLPADKIRVGGKDCFFCTPLQGININEKEGKSNLPSMSISISIKIAVVTRPWKIEVAEYVSHKLPGITVETVMFNEAYSEWPGSIYSASEFFSENNLVLFPDSYLRLSEGSSCLHGTYFNDKRETLVELVLNALKEYKLVFGSVKCTDKKILKQLGAMRVEDGEVSAFQDKPSQNVEQFNSFWGCYGFRKEYGRAIYDFLIKSVQHQPVSLKEQPFCPVGTIPLHSYRDLGTWENIKRFRQGCF